MNSGSTYGLIAGVTNCGGAGSDQTTGQFSTSAAPTNEFVGWVSQITANPYELDQVAGPTSPPASVWINAYCNYEYNNLNTGGLPQYYLKQVAFPPVASSSNGSYALGGFPEALVYTYDTTGTPPLPVQVTLSLSSSGTCTTTDQFDDYIPPVTNSHYLLQADAEGFWNATVWVSSTLSASNDYQQFGLWQNGQQPSAVAIAFVHTSEVMCNVTVVQGGSQTVYQSIGGNGFEDQQTYGSFSEALGVPGSNSDVTQDWRTTGLLNESRNTIHVLNTWAYGKPISRGTNDVNYSDPLGSTWPSNATPWFVGPGGDIEGWDSGGSYVSTSGEAIQVGVITGWGGTGLDLSVPLVYTTSTVTSSGWQFACHFGGPPAGSGENNEYYYSLDSSAAASGDAVYVHIWFDRTCEQGPGCN